MMESPAYPRLSCPRAAFFADRNRTRPSRRTGQRQVAGHLLRFRSLWHPSPCCRPCHPRMRAWVFRRSPSGQSWQRRISFAEQVSHHLRRQWRRETNNEGSDIETPEQAEAKAHERTATKNKIPVPENATFRCRKPSPKAKSRCRYPSLRVKVRKPSLLSISRVGDTVPFSIPLTHLPPLTPTQILT